MTSFDILIAAIAEIPENSTLLATSPVVIGALLYFIGKIRLSNSWQYHLDERHSAFFHGVVALNNVVILPILIILFFAKFNWLISWGGLALILLFFFDAKIHAVTMNQVKRISRTQEQSAQQLNIFNLNWDELFFKFKLKIITLVGPVVLFLLSYWVLISTDEVGVLLIVLFLDLLSILRFAHIDSLGESRKNVDIKMKGKRNIFHDARIIEFLNGGALCKFQYEKKVSVVNSQDIERIDLKG